MKNIHILPTDKPSRLHYSKIKNNDKISYKLVLKKEFSKCNDGLLSGQRYIYITSDEEIKEGDWWLNLKTNDVDKCTHKSEVLLYNSEKYEYIKKIILTTDQNLIKDGVQQVDDEFLEWFVKNPSCEEVEFKKESEFYRSGPLDLLGYNIVTYKITIPEKITRCCGRCNGVDDLCYSDMTCDNHKERGCEICYGKRIEYQINIPKEEPKQETLEEVAEKLYPKTKNQVIDFANELRKEGFLKGAKWQQERSYSEEDLKLLLKKFKKDIINSTELDDDFETLVCDIETNKWFEQFKKK